MSQKALEGMVRIGVVSAAAPGTRKVRVLFSDTGVTSGWLYVLQHIGAGVSATPDGEHTHDITDGQGERGSASTMPVHSHPGSYLSQWMPGVGASVLVLYIPVDDGDGFVLGGI